MSKRSQARIARNHATMPSVACLEVGEGKSPEEVIKEQNAVIKRLYSRIAELEQQLEDNADAVLDAQNIITRCESLGFQLEVQRARYRELKATYTEAHSALMETINQ